MMRERLLELREVYRQELFEQRRPLLVETLA